MTRPVRAATLGRNYGNVEEALDKLAEHMPYYDEGHGYYDFRRLLGKNWDGKDS